MKPSLNFEAEPTSKFRLTFFYIVYFRLSKWHTLLAISFPDPPKMNGVLTNVNATEHHWFSPLIATHLSR